MSQIQVRTFILKMLLKNYSSIFMLQKKPLIHPRQTTRNIYYLKSQCFPLIIPLATNKPYSIFGLSAANAPKQKASSKSRKEWWSKDKSLFFFFMWNFKVPKYKIQWLNRAKARSWGTRTKKQTVWDERSKWIWQEGGVLQCTHIFVHPHDHCGNLTASILH